MGRGGKVAVGVVALGVLGLGAWALWPKAAAATKSSGPTPGAPRPIVLTDQQLRTTTGVALAVNQPLVLQLSVTAGGAPNGGPDWALTFTGAVTVNDEGIFGGVHTFSVLPTGPGAATVTVAQTSPAGSSIAMPAPITLPITIAPTTGSFQAPGTSGPPRRLGRMSQVHQLG